MDTCLRAKYLFVLGSAHIIFQTKDARFHYLKSMSVFGVFLVHAGMRENSRIRAQYREIPYSFQMQEKTNQKISEYERFSGSENVHLLFEKYSMSRRTKRYFVRKYVRNYFTK